MWFICYKAIIRSGKAGDIPPSERCVLNAFTPGQCLPHVFILTSSPHPTSLRLRSTEHVTILSRGSVNYSLGPVAFCFWMAHEECFLHY